MSLFTVIGPTADLVNPGDSGAIGQAVINGRGFIDVPFATPAGATLSTSTILGLSTPPFTLGGTDATAGRLEIDTTQAPVSWSARRDLHIPVLDDRRAHNQ